ncbi:OmpA family protein [Hymenobacter yonginensis]|uniref:OmpA family protein n=1 Tax=Hymenobacter yonginensis TaxID=748197 RepID=A0ABY7PRY1_9BACT|nr:OmpA family protein [Hymenobacter yonginensis]WBO85601.1 OmpA family protein [Hymenobacter yonginensis]
MKPLFTSILLLFWCLLACAAPGDPQAPVGIVGTVRSADNQVLAKASVLVIYVPTGKRHTTSTDAAGNFAVTELAVGGPYTVQVSQPNYQPEVVNDVFLLTGKTANGTFVLHPADKAAAPARRKAGKEKLATGADANPALLASAGQPAAAAAPTRYHLTYIQQCRIIPSGPAMASAQPMAAGPSAANRPAAVPAPVAASAAAVPARMAAPSPALVPAKATALAPPAAATTAATGAVAAPDAPIRTTRPAFRPGSRSPKAIEAPAIGGHYDAGSGNYIYDTGAPTTLQLADGKKLSGVGINSIETRLHHFLADPKQQIDTVDRTHGWMSFDRVYFETGKATLTKESMQQLKNIALLLQSYPQTRIKLGGYTDSVGAYQMNRQLSEARARTAWAALVELGVSPSRLEARGYGSNYPVASNATPAGRAMNRRLSVRVISK